MSINLIDYVVYLRLTGLRITSKLRPLEITNVENKIKNK